jgi:pectin methylesterase-like acyl-CoA thioesterase
MAGVPFFQMDMLKKKNDGLENVASLGSQTRVSQKQVSSFCPMKNCLRHFCVGFTLFFAVTSLPAAVLWTGSSGTDTNWSTGGNWLNGSGTGGVPGPADDVVFGVAGSGTSVNGISNVVDSTSGNFLGSIGSLSYTNNGGGSFQNTLIEPGLTLNVTNNTGPFGSALFVGTPTQASAAVTITASISGPGATLNVSNTNAVISISQSASSSALAVLDLTNLDNFTGNVRAVGIGDYYYGIGAVAAEGELMLAKTNVITTSWVGNYGGNDPTVPVTNAFHMGVGNGGTLGNNYCYLGLTNTFFVDSIGVGGVKGGTASTFAFNPVFTNSTPSAYFRGINGNARVTQWSIGDNAGTGGSSASTQGIVDFGNGTVDAMVGTMILGRDRNSGTAASGDAGTVRFSAGTINVNTLYLADQAGTTTATAITGTMNLSGANGATPTLVVNGSLNLGYTTLTTGATLSTAGKLNVTNGMVLASNIVVGAVSTNNTIILTNSTLIVSNSLATNASGLAILSIANSTLDVPVPASGTLAGLVQTLNVAGTANLIKLDSIPVFATYPATVPLVQYTTLTGTFNFNLASPLVSAPGAYITNLTTVPKSIALVVPSDPRPVFTAQPSPYSGSPGDNVTTNFQVSISAGSVTPLGYQWYYVSGGVTNLLTDGVGPSGTSTLSGSATTNLQILNAQPLDSGNYFVVATNQFGTNSSSEALLTISAGAILPTVTGPTTVTATNGVTTVIANAYSGSPLPVLFWQFDGTNIADGPGPSGSSTLSGTTTSTLTIMNPQHPGDEGTYSLIASNSAGMATNNIVLTVIIPPGITTQPTSLVVTNTQTASFTVVATGVPAPTYQWRKNGAAILSTANPTATNATFTIASTSPGDIATYACTVSNPAGTTNTVNVTLTVNSSGLTAVSLLPANGQTGVSYDTPLYINFSQVPTLRTAGKIQIYAITNSTTPVDVIDLSQGTVQSRTIATETLNTYPVIITGSTAAIYPHLDLLSSNQTYYVTVDNGVFADSAGAYFAGITATNAWQFTTKTGGPANATNLVVAQDYSGDFATVQGALDAVPANNTTPTLIHIANGTYTEIVDIHAKNNLLLRGQSRAGTIIGYANNALIAPGGSTHYRMAFKVNANNIALDNLTVTNETAQDLAQAEALLIESGAAQVIVNNCNIDSYQDTILANISTSKAYFNRSLIQGDVDFIWGGGNLFFTNCDILWLVRAANAAALGPNPSPTATDINSNGFSFVNCSLMTQLGANPADTIGRTRGITNGNTALINCFVSTNLGGWYSDASPTSEFRNWYSGCTNDYGNAASLSNGIALASSDPDVVLASSATRWLYGWTPALSPNIIGQPASQSTSAGLNPSFTVSATGIPDPAYQWYKNGVAIPGATNATLAFTAAVRTNAGSYSVIVSNASGTVTGSNASLTYTGDVAPVAGPSFTLGAVVGVPATVQIIGGKYSPTDADGDPLTITGVSGAVNGTVTTDGINVTYTATGGTSDSFSYTVSDGLGGTDSQTIDVNIATGQSYNQVSAQSVAGQVVLTYYGIPNYNYALDWTHSLTPPVTWTPLFTNSTAINGLLLFTNTPSGDADFYRTRSVP